MVLYLNNTKDSTKKLLEAMNYSNVAGYKICTQKYTAFLHVKIKRLKIKNPTHCYLLSYIKLNTGGDIKKK